ncbi:MAG: hypothetical protein ROZ64_11790 [Burkholderiaceae bacterium]|jgi:hypothetical protein|nr:hypothetical protein [Burkholderiaceae bacterium]
MRTFEDDRGRRWQAALLEASWGNVLLLFSAFDGDDTRQQLLDAQNMSEAVSRLAVMSDDELRALLSTASAWDPGRAGA